jgi:hypothetical protein
MPQCMSLARTSTCGMPARAQYRCRADASGMVAGTVHLPQVTDGSDGQLMSQSEGEPPRAMRQRAVVSSHTLAERFRRVKRSPRLAHNLISALRSSSKTCRGGAEASISKAVFGS